MLIRRLFLRDSVPHVKSMPGYATTPALPDLPTESDQRIPSVHEAKAEARVAKAAVKRAKAEAKVAARRAALAKAEHAQELQSERENRVGQDLELARRGYKRTFFGRIVPVRQSWRSRAHTRKI